VKIAPTLHTEHLDLRPWSDADVAMLTDLSVDPDVIRYIGNGQPWTPQRAAEVAEAALAHWERHGFGWRVAGIRETGEKIGLIALNFAGEGTRGVGRDEYEIGWWLAPPAWRRGLAVGRTGEPVLVFRLTRPAAAHADGRIDTREG
jgi:RimJ/RimL family protein N-acetyltransferase